MTANRKEKFNEIDFSVKFIVDTFNFLSFLVADIPCDVHRVANQGTPTSMVYRPLNGRFVFYDIHSQPNTLRKCSEFVIGRFYLDCVEGYESSLAHSLVTHIFDAVYGCLFLIDNNRFEVTT